MRKILSICLGLLLIAGTVMSDPIGPAGTKVEPGQKGVKLSYIDVEDAMHSCGEDNIDNVNEVSALFDVKAHIYQSYCVKLEGFKINIQKWEVGQVEFTVKGGWAAKDLLPKFTVLSNAQHLVSICCVKNPEDCCANELETGYRLVDSGGSVKVDDTKAAAYNCILCKKVTCSCGAVLYDPDHCSLCQTCRDKGTGLGCTLATTNIGYNMKGSGNTGNKAGYVEEGEFGVSKASGSPGSVETYYLEVWADNKWTTPAGDYTGGEVKVVFHPNI